MDINDIQRFYDDTFFSGKGFKVPGNFYFYMLDLLHVTKGKKLLDVGCGDGHFLSIAEKSGLITYGVDISKKAVKTARKNASASKIIVGNAQNLPWGDCTFDYVTCLGSLEHLDKCSQGVREIGRVLKESGRVNIVVPNSFSLVNIWKVYREGDIIKGQPIERFATRKEWKKIIEDNGLKVIETHKYNHLFWRITNLGNLIYRLIDPFIPLNLTFHFIFICTKRKEL